MSAPKFSMARIMNPSGLDKELFHSDRCDKYYVQHGSIGHRLASCLCAVAKRVRKVLAIDALRETKEWGGSTVTTVQHNGRLAHRLVHPSGAVMHVYAEPVSAAKGVAS